MMCTCWLVVLLEYLSENCTLGSKLVKLSVPMKYRRRGVTLDSAMKICSRLEATVVRLQDIHKEDSACLDAFIKHVMQPALVGDRDMEIWTPECTEKGDCTVATVHANCEPKCYEHKDKPKSHKAYFICAEERWSQH